MFNFKYTKESVQYVQFKVHDRICMCFPLTIHLYTCNLTDEVLETQARKKRQVRPRLCDNLDTKRKSSKDEIDIKNQQN